jgi:nicotinic acid mononucleotide adenylyltransferase
MVILQFVYRRYSSYSATRDAFFAFVTWHRFVLHSDMWNAVCCCRSAVGLDASGAMDASQLGHMCVLAQFKIAIYDCAPMTAESHERRRSCCQCV